ncbi:DUF748 domain-containing protein [Cellvibrio sp. UBA7661]|uniref:DUF748 domain-containing protein n=1 Tax=Cellvibrio sp. UBA7661 TaxID=1946311 RepID=UPI002F358631
MTKETANTSFRAKYLAWLSWRRPWVWLLGLLLSYNLALAVIAPMVIKNRLNDIVVNQLKLNLDIGGISINPYEFTLEINDAKISGQGLDQPLGFDRLFVDLQVWNSLSSLWQLGEWKFNEVQLTGIYGEFKRINSTTHNFTHIFNNLKTRLTGPSDNNTTVANTLNDGTSVSPLKLFIENIYVQVEQFHIEDQLRKNTFKTDIGPIDFHIQQFSSLPNTTGQQSLHLKTDRGVELSWKGNISVAPFASKGDVTINGPLLTTLADYFSEEFNVAITTGDYQSTFKYDIHQTKRSAIAVHIFDIQTQAKNIKASQLTNNAPLLSLNEIILSGGEFKWPEEQVHIPDITLSTGDLWLTTTQDGTLNWAQLSAADDHSDAEKSAWQFTNNTLSVTGINLHYTDSSISTASQVKVSNIAFQAKNLSTKENQPVEVSANFYLQGGKFESAARLQINPLKNAAGTYTITKFPMKAMQTFIDDYALVDIIEGELSAEGKITSKEEVIQIQGNALIDQFTLQEKSSGKPILTWSQLRINRIIANTQDKKINIGRMRFDKAFADFNVFPDGSHTLSRVLVLPEKPAEPATVTTTDPASEFTYLIGRIDFDDASGKFSDASLPLPFSADITHINGTISTLDSTSNTPADVKLEGQVSDFGEMVMSGAIFPLEPTQKTRMQLTFNNIDIADFSPYSIKFAGREIAKGKMNLDLEYEINKSQMLGKNNIVLHDFALGKKVAQPGAADLPLDLAIALLKDKDGTIRADLPVQGNVDDPQFDYSKTIRRALSKLITNVAAAPFRFLAGLVGVGSNKDLGYISFFAGRTDLSPAQTEKVQQLGEAMLKRPDLQITIAGAYSATFDTDTLKEEKFNAALRGQISQNLTDANIGSRKYIATLEKLYAEKNLTPSLDELKRNALNQPDDESDNMDRLAYVRSIKDALVATEVISQEDLIQLANKRAQVVYEQLSQTPGIDISHIKMAAAHEGQLNKDNKLKLELKASLKKTKSQKIASP